MKTHIRQLIHSHTTAQLLKRHGASHLKQERPASEPHKGKAGIEDKIHTKDIHKSMTWMALLLVEFIMILILYKCLVDSNDALSICQYLKE